MFLGAGEPIYVSPTGSGFVGTIGNPTSLTNALTSGLNFYMMDGVYTKDSIVVSAGVTMQAADGARPVIVHSDGAPPAVQLNNGCTVSGIWFGGSKQASDRPFQMADNCTVTNNTLFGYYGGIVEGGHTGNLYQGNRFINCGKGTLDHDIYISGNSSSQILDNIFLGGEGYKIHLWQEVANITVSGNFVADTQHFAVFRGTGNTFNKNVWWKPVSGSLVSPVFLNSGSGPYNNSFHALLPLTPPYTGELNNHSDWFGTWTLPDGITASGNYYAAEQAECDTGTLYDWSQVSTLLGYSEAQIDAAVSALESSFAESVATIQADATIEGNFTILKNVINTWKTK